MEGVITRVVGALKMYSSRFIEGVKNHQPAELFLAMGLVFGLGFLIFAPPMQAPDDVEHFYRSYQLTEFNIMSDPVTAKGHGGVGSGFGGSLPVSVVNVAEDMKGKVAGGVLKFDYGVLRDSAGVPLERSKRQNIRFDNTTIYSPVPYIPQALGIGIGKVVNLGPLYLMYLGRLLNLVFWLSVIYAAIRLTPLGKWAFLAVALNPISVYLAASFSSDTFTIALVALFVAVILRLRQMKAIPSRLWFVTPFVLAVMIALLKNAYIPLVLLLLLIPAPVIALRVRLAVIGAAVALGLVWNYWVLSAAKDIPEYFGLTARIDAREQVIYVLTHPLESLWVFVWNIFGTPSVLVSKTYNSLIGWGDVPLPFWVSLLSLIGLALALLYRDAASDTVKRVLTKQARYTFAGIFLLSAGAIIASLYVGWTEVSKNIVAGIQGRYYIPITFLLIPAISHTGVWIGGSKRSFSKLMIWIYGITLAVSVIIVAIRYRWGIWW